MKGSTPCSLEADHTKDDGMTPLDEGIADTFASASRRQGLQRHAIWSSFGARFRFIRSPAGRMTAGRRLFANGPCGLRLSQVNADTEFRITVHHPTRIIMATNQKVAVITGASRGIGAALVKAYRNLNYFVVANSRSIEPSADGGVLAVPGDIGDRAVAERVISQGIARFGRIDTLINNAGIFIAKPFTQYTAKDYAAVLATNLAGFFYVSQFAVAEMEKKNFGHIVSITTSLLRHANSNVPSVLASLTKGGVDAATRSLAIEYAKRGIRVNAVAPGIIKTPMHPAQTHAALAGMHPVNRMGEMSDIVEAVMFLEKAGFVTGETLHVDGGQSAGH
jgi:NAD(P)-dependent dehydrogenase (short-subunit alcohol dehydrogenase family)